MKEDVSNLHRKIHGSLPFLLYTLCGMCLLTLASSPPVKMFQSLLISAPLVLSCCIFLCRWLTSSFMQRRTMKQVSISTFLTKEDIEASVNKYIPHKVCKRKYKLSSFVRNVLIDTCFNVFLCEECAYWHWKTLKQVSISTFLTKYVKGSTNYHG
jgi:hypothetical protein